MVGYLSQQKQFKGEIRRLKGDRGKPMQENELKVSDYERKQKKW